MVASTNVAVYRPPKEAPELDPKPHSIDVDLELLRTTALLIIDMQNGFCHPEGSAAKSGLDIEAQRAIVPRIIDVIAAAESAGVPIFWSRQEHLEGDLGRLRHGLQTHIEKGGYLPCLRGTWDAEILEELTPYVRPDHIVFTKHRASCFFNSTLDSSLRMRGVTAIIVAGVTTNYCVDSTVRDAYARDYDLLILEDAVAASTSYEDLHRATLKNAALFHGVVLKAKQVVAMLEALHPVGSLAPDTVALSLRRPSRLDRGRPS